MRCRRHQQQVARLFRQPHPQLVALALAHVVAVPARAHLVRLVDHHQIPLRLLDQLSVLFLLEQIDPRDQPILLQQRIPRRRAVEHRPIRDREPVVKFLAQLVLPLLGEVGRRHDQAALHIAAQNQLADQQPRHNRLARARIVREQEAQRLPRQHLVVHRRDLVRQRLHIRKMHRQPRVEAVRLPDPLRLRRELKQLRIRVERPLLRIPGHAQPR